MQKIDSLMKVPDVDAFFIDVYGVLYDGLHYYPRAVATCRQLMKKGVRVYVVSNATTVSSYFKQKHAQKGFIQWKDYTDVVTSGDVLKAQLEQGFLDTVAGKRGKWTLMGRPNPLLTESIAARWTDDMDKAQAVYVGALEENGRYFATLSRYLPTAKKALKLGLPIICANPDYYAFEKDFKHVVQGLLAKWYEDKGGRVYWFGKPYADIYHYALALSKTRASRTVMVGDTLRTDIAGGQRAGLRTVLVTGTGMTASDLTTHPIDYLLKKEKVAPTYEIKGFKK